MQILLTPMSNEVSSKHFLSTIETPVDFIIVEPHLDEEGTENLQCVHI